LVDFSVSGKGSHAAEAANDNSDLTHGADAEAICGNPVRGLRARRADGRSSSGQQDDPGAAAAGDDGVARKTSPIDELDIIEELRRWKMQTAEKVDQINLSDDEGDEEDELVFSESATADAGRIGRHSNGIVNVLRIPRDMKVVEKLVENNANVNLANNSGATPIYNACYNGHYEVVDHLIQKGASLSMQNNNGDTPLHIAVSFSQLSIVDSLIKSGARTTIKNNDGKVAIDMIESETVRAAVNDVLPKASVNGSDARGGGGGTGVGMPVWKPPVSLPAASLSTPAMKTMVAKFKATLAAHEAIEPKTLLRSLQGSLDKLSWWKFENQFEGADASSAAPPSQRVVTSDDLVPLCAYLRFSSQCGVDIRPTSLEIRIEEHQDSGMRAFFLLPMQSSLVKPAPVLTWYTAAVSGSRSASVLSLPPGVAFLPSRQSSGTSWIS